MMVAACKEELNNKHHSQGVLGIDLLPDLMENSVDCGITYQAVVFSAKNSGKHRRRMIGLALLWEHTPALLHIACKSFGMLTGVTFKEVITGDCQAL